MYHFSLVWLVTVQGNQVSEIENCSLLIQNVSLKYGMLEMQTGRLYISLYVHLYHSLSSTRWRNTDVCCNLSCTLVPSSACWRLHSGCWNTVGPLRGGHMGDWRHNPKGGCGTLLSSFWSWPGCSCSAACSPPQWAVLAEAQKSQSRLITHRNHELKQTFSPYNWLSQIFIIVMQSQLTVCSYLWLLGIVSRNYILMIIDPAK